MQPPSAIAYLRYVDHGMMRNGETEQDTPDVEAVFGALDVVDAGDQFLDPLAGVPDPEEKRKIIGETSSASLKRPRSVSTAAWPAATLHG